MKQKRRSAFLGAAFILFALAVRLGGGVTVASGHALRPQETPAVTLNRWPRGGVPAATPPVTQPPTQPPAQPPVTPTFSAADLKKVQMRYASGCKYRPDLQTLMASPLLWDLDNGEPAVLILHTHGCESYTKTADQNYKESGNFRTRNKEYNLIAVGKLLAERLEEAGIGVIHDTVCHDDPSYDDAYKSARASAKEYLERYPSIQLVLDLHRDAATYSDGTQYATGVTVDGQRIAELMLVMGTDSSGLHYPNWRDNLSVALKVLAQLETEAPGITRTTTLRTSRYNQDLHGAMLLVEVGSAGNTLDQAKAAVEYLAKAIIALKDGANLGT